MDTCTHHQELADTVIRIEVKQDSMNLRMDGHGNVMRNIEKVVYQLKDMLCGTEEKAGLVHRVTAIEKELENPKVAKNDWKDWAFRAFLGITQTCIVIVLVFLLKLVGVKINLQEIGNIIQSIMV